MKTRTIAALLCASLVPALGIEHCPTGDSRVFGEPCVQFAVPGQIPPTRVVVARPFSKVVTVDSRTSDLTHASTVRSRLEVTTCGAAYSRIADGAIEEFGLVRFESGDPKALHDALVEAGGLDVDSAPFNPLVCAISSYTEWNEVAVYEPSPLPGTAWSNSFSFGTCARSSQTDAIESILSSWIGAHFDLSQPLPATVTLPDDPQVFP